MFGTIDAWLIYKLTGERATDASNASRTHAARHLARGDWDDELLELFGVPAARAARGGRPAVAESARRAPTRFTGTRSPSPGSPAISRRRCSARRASTRAWARTRTGRARSCSRTPATRPRRRPRGCSEPLPGGSATGSTYALEAAIFVTGAAVQWLRDGLGIIDVAADTEALAASLDGNDGVYFVPALTGLGSPHWDPYARGTIVGLTRGVGKAHLARAALEAIAYQTVDAVQAMEAACGNRADRAPRRRRRDRQRLADAVPGRRARRAGLPARDRRDDRARRRLPGRRRHRRLDDRSA